MRVRPRGLVAGLSIILIPVSAVAQTITVRAGKALDGRGGVLGVTNIVIDGSTITRLAGTGVVTPTYDLSRFTVLPGLIDTHVHIDSHFGKDGRASNTGETPGQRALYA